MQFTLVDLWAHMGLFARLIVAVMTVMSLGSLVVMVERLFAYSRSSGESKAYAARVGPVLESGRLAEAAEAAGSPDVGHLGRVINAGLKAFKTAPKEKESALD